MENSGNTPSNFFFQLDEFYLDLREDGRSISFLDKKEIEKNPYPGLRPFKTSEFQLFNGRDGQAEELIRRLKKNKFLAVIGSSGTGKSSLVRAGLIPQILGGYLYGAGTKWDVAVCRPGKDPVENLAIALARTNARSNKNEEIISQYHLIEPLLNRSIYGILDVNELLNPPGNSAEEKANLLIVIDQFEELFRFNRDDLGKPDIENLFVNLLLKTALKQDVSIYVIITMRSEFLGDCVKYRGLPEAINEGQYLVPQLSREHIKEVIEDPILLAGKKIAPGLVELLVNEIEESKTKKDLDQLPILQHALMRTYQEAMKKEGTTEITYEHYVAAGGMENALANHVEKKYLELGKDVKEESFKQKIAKIIFQALTDASTDQKRGRRPTELSTLYNIAASLKASQQEVDEVINHFRDTDTSFIMPPLNTALYPELIMDISHESLMRQWSRLKDWVAEEAENGRMLIRLSEYQKLYKQGTKDPLEGKELAQMWDWYQSFNPQPAWSERYSTDYKESFQYLDESEAKMKLAQEKIESERLKKIRRSKILLVGAFCIILITGLITGYMVNRYNEEQKAIEKTNARLAFLLEKRKDAIGNERKLQPLIFTTEALLLEKNQKAIDSILKNCIKNKLLPDYSLKNMYLNSSMVAYASLSTDEKTIHIWKGDSTFSELNVESGDVVRSGKYIVDSDTTIELIRRSKWKLISNNANKLTDTTDFVRIDSSNYFKHQFATILEKDAAGFYVFPELVRNIDGAAYSNDGSLILTWGRNSESIWAAVDIWNRDEDGITSAGVSLIHDGIYGAAFSRDKNLILTWGSDSTVRLWHFINDTSIIHLPVKLLKMKIQVATGVEMNQEDYSITIIPPLEYIKRKEEFLAEYQKYQDSKTSQK